MTASPLSIQPATQISTQMGPQIPLRESLPMRRAPRRRLRQPAALRLAALLFAGLAFLGGCAVTPPAPPAAPDNAELLAEARQALARGDHQAAARAHLRLAERAARAGEALSAVEHRLQAADLLLQGNHLEEVRRILAHLPERLPEQAPAAVSARRTLLLARLALAENHPRQALERLRSLEGDVRLPSDLAAAVHEWRARAYLRAGNLLESVRERVALDTLLPVEDATRRRENQIQLWQTLQRLSEPALRALRLAPPPDVLSGWLELAQIAREAQRRPQTVRERVAEWRLRYPGHPVEEEIIAAVLARQLDEVRRPQHIALLLPHHGPYGRAAAALRDGFLAAHYAREFPDYRPIIRIYDVPEDPNRVVAVYHRAVQEGAELVVGPLRKAAVDRLLELGIQGGAFPRAGRLPVTTLTLNYASHLPARVPAGLFQFGLAPEDEARQVAERAWLDGHNQALALLPEGPWGQRLLNAFRETWEALGGKLLEYQFYPPKDNDFSPSIQALLNLDESYAQRRAVEAVIGRPVKFEPRRRQDADFLFLGAFPRQARLIRPQLKFHYASRLPVYATSHLFTGRPDRNADRDMDGIVFCDIPWVLGDPPPLKRRVEALWPQSATQYTRFYALGADAYRLIPLLENLHTYRHERFSGATGTLYLVQGNRLFRELTWAHFRNGLPRPY